MDKAKKMLMTDSFEIKGIWFLPGQDIDECGIQGILRYTPEQIILDLIGVFKGVDLDDDTSTTCSIIKGFSDAGEYFTLWDCTLLSLHMPAPGFDTISYYVQKFYSGTQFMENEAICSVKEVAFSFTNLNAWLDYKMMEQRSSKDHR